MRKLLKDLYFGNITPADRNDIRAHPAKHRVRPDPSMDRGASHTKSNQS